MKKIIILLTLVPLLLTSCNAVGTQDGAETKSSSVLPVFSSETQSSEAPSSEMPSSKVSSVEPQSSEIPSSAKPSSKPASKPPASSQLSQEELDEIASNKSQEEYQKELETLTKAYINFTVTDKSGNSVQGVGTEFDTNTVPNTSWGPYAFNDKTGITNKSGETSVNLIQYNLMNTVDSVWIRWDCQFTATLTVPDGRVYTAKAVKEEGSDKYVATFGRSSNGSLKITVADNNTYTFGVTVDDTAE